MKTFDANYLNDCWLTSGLDASDWMKIPLENIRRLLAKLADDLAIWRESTRQWVEDRWRHPDSPWSLTVFARAIGMGCDIDELDGKSDLKTARAICTLLNLLAARERAALAAALSVSFA